MENKEKLEALKSFLKENKISFKENWVLKKDTSCDLYLKKFHICVRLSKADDQEFYSKVKYGYHPLFIRENETKEFVLEKMQNLIIDLMKQKQSKFMKK